MNTWYESGHVAIVTGGSRGLGKALARELLTRGLHVIIDGRDRAALALANAELSKDELGKEGDLIAIPGNVADLEHVHELVAAARKLGRLDLLVNNASTLGSVPLPRIDELTAEAFSDLFNVNVFAPIHLIQHALPLMGKHGFGTILNITSDAGAEAYPSWGGYGASKAALEHVSRVLAAELESNGIRILVADPGDMNTQMHRDAIPDAVASGLRDPADVARGLVRAIAEMQAPYERVQISIGVPA